jgi:hypothetical protein
VHLGGLLPSAERVFNLEQVDLGQLLGVLGLGLGRGGAVEVLADDGLRFFGVQLFEPSLGHGPLGQDGKRRGEQGTMVEKRRVLLRGRRFCQSFGIQPPWLCSMVTSWPVLAFQNLVKAALHST